MLDYPSSPVPEICISPAPDVEYAEEPQSPFDCLSPKFAQEDGYRPSLLSPPPSAGSRGRLSPLRPDDSPVSGKGLARERFDALLTASRERNAAVGAKKATDLRKEIALKAHKSKQLERRALFLSKVKAPPSPSAADMPKTPPESPAIFHYSLPSPGLVSPLSLFESIANNDPTLQGLSRQPWVEQVDFRLPEGVAPPRETLKPKGPASPRSRRTRSIPSLEEITAHLGAHGHVVPVPAPAPEITSRRLPAFLQSAPSRKPSPPPAVVVTPAPAEPKQRRPLPIGVGRLRMPVRPAPGKPADPVTLAAPIPKSPGAPKSPNLRITTTVVPRSSTTSPVGLTEVNLSTLNFRARTARDMLSALRRRTAGPASSQNGLTGHDEDEEIRKSFKRHSSPAELPRRERCGFAHPILALPGAF